MVNASLAYEILLYLNSFYFGLFVSCEIGIGVMKTINLNYSAFEAQVDMGIMTVTMITEAFRIYFGRKGSLSEHGWQVITSVILTIPSASGMYYLLMVQINIIKLERILCALMLALQSTELVYAVIFIFTTCRPQTYT